MNFDQERSRPVIIWVIIIISVLFLLCNFSSTLLNLYTDFLWFESLDATEILNKRLGTSIILTLIGGVISSAFLLLNWSLIPHWIAPKTAFKGTIPISKWLRVRPETTHKEFNISTKPIRLLFTVIAIALGIIIGLTLSSLWQTYLLARHGGSFGSRDPIFSMDLGFYTFTLPWYQALLIRAKALIALGFIGVLLRYFSFGQAQARRPIAHMSLLGTLWLVLIGLGRLLDRYVLLQSELGITFGAGYTDVNARLPLYTIEAILFIAAGAILVVNAFTRRWKFLVYIGIFWLVLSAAGPLYPAMIQQFTVEPNEFVVEKPYIEHNIHYTRLAYGLDKIEEQQYPASGTITTADLEANSDVINNVRLWDYRPLLRTYSQLQEIRLYYTFNNVDIDRYVINDELRGVMLAARELNVDELAEQAQTWINRHIIFTHGYGLTLNNVNEITKEGLPNLLVRDIPPESSVPELEITRPQIYFGESTKEYVVINATEDEFDYPQGDSNMYNRYDGPDGVRLGHILRRALLAAHFNSTQMLLSPALSGESRILFHRTIHDRASTLAPMLWYDDDTYPVIADGKIIWLLDAYTWTDHFPYAEPVEIPEIGRVNYLRNSVKVAVDAYTGEIDYYLVDPSDPIATAYAEAFPDLFKPVDAMPAVLRDHWRYPETLFLIQSHLYATYHMRDPQVFYNREDLWDIPTELIETEQRIMEPYYVLMRTPNSEELEFMLIRPYVPKQKQNMVAWLFANCDGDKYGQLGIFKLSKDRLVYGPQQIEARADQNPTISQQLSLWNQRGSRVLRGNLLVIPLKGTFLYIEPLYLEAESGQLPELKRVIVAYDDRVAMAPTLSEALIQVLDVDQDQVVGVGDTDTSKPETVDGNLSSLAQQALEHYQAAQACLADGDWECYGREQTALENILRAMVSE